MESNILILKPEEIAVSDINIKQLQESGSFNVYIIEEEEQDEGLRNEHVEKGENSCTKENKSNDCAVCMKRFNSPSQLKTHMRTHSTHHSKERKKYSLRNNLQSSSRMDSLHRISNQDAISPLALTKENESTRIALSDMPLPDQSAEAVPVTTKGSDSKDISPAATVKTAKGSVLARAKAQYQCPDCMMVFTAKKKLAHHRTTHFDSFQCPSCEQMFQKKNNLEKHVLAKHTIVTCELCSEELPNALDLQKHKKNHHMLTLHCEVCNKTLRRGADLKRHMRIHSDKRPFECEHCGKSFIENHYLKLHLRLHTGEKPFACDSCERKFRTSSELGKHRRIHTGEKPYSCNQCDKTFRTLGQLISHRVVHNNEKQFKCETCQDLFRRAGDLKRHMVKHTAEKPFQCPVCEKRFPRRDTLNTHVKIHSSEKPFPCTQCDRAYAQRHVLKEHMKSHSGERPHRCQFCNKGFLRNKDRKRHEMCHTGEKPFQCSLCEKRFTQRGNLKKHIKLHASQLSAGGHTELAYHFNNSTHIAMRQDNQDVNIDKVSPAEEEDIDLVVQRATEVIQQMNGKESNEPKSPETKVSPEKTKLKGLLKTQLSANMILKHVHSTLSNPRVNFSGVESLSGIKETVDQVCIVYDVVSRENNIVEQDKLMST